MALLYFCAVLCPAVLCWHAEAMLLEQSTMRCRKPLYGHASSNACSRETQRDAAGTGRRRDPIHKLSQHVYDMNSSDLMTLLVIGLVAVLPAQTKV